MCAGGCQSRLAATTSNLLVASLTALKMRSPSVTGSAPPGQKSTCGSTISSASRPSGRRDMPVIIAFAGMDLTEPVLLTAEGLERLKQELEVVRERRREAQERMREAFQPGDIEDNPEYEQAKEEVALLDS